MNPKLTDWGERYLYAPDTLQKALSCALFPLSGLYCLGAWLRYRLASPKHFPIPVISVGNLTVGGSGKTPLVCALAARHQKAAVVLRGYGRKSEGLVVVKDGSGIRCNVEISGDEAMIYAQKLQDAVVIVSEKREIAIEKAVDLGCEIVFLDDGYGKHSIEKFDIIIDVKTPNRFCLPSGPYRERLWSGKKALVVREGEHFRRVSELKSATDAMVLVSAIARPQRLDAYLPDGLLGKYYFADHHYFERDELEAILRQSGAKSLLVTYKDYVKMADMELPLSLLDLELELDPVLAEAVGNYIEKERHAKEY